MRAYKCDVCGKYYENGGLEDPNRLLNNVTFGTHFISVGNADKYDNERHTYDLQVCNDCFGYFCAGLAERGCRDKLVIKYAADYIKQFAPTDEDSFEKGE